MLDELDLEAVMRHMAEGHRAEGLRSMSEFEPDQPSAVHDRLNDEMFKWVPAKYAAGYRQRADEFEPGVVERDGLLLDGWKPLKRY
jgi:hypothetical protein